MGVVATSATRLGEGFHLHLVLPTNTDASVNYGSVAVTLADFYDMLVGSILACTIVLDSIGLLCPLATSGLTATSLFYGASACTLFDGLPPPSVGRSEPGQ